MKALVLIVMAIGTRVTTLDPFKLNGIDAFEATANVVEPLARREPRTRELTPVLARDWKIDEKKGTFRVFLRPRVKFHDGTRLTAEDVKFTFDAYRERGELWRGMVEDLADVRVVKPLTLEFRAKRKPLRYATFLNAMNGIRILPRGYYERTPARKLRTKMVGTGPFYVESFARDGTLQLAPFAQWWGRPRPDFFLRIKTVTDPTLAPTMIAKGALDFMKWPISSQPPAQAQKFEGGEGLWIDLNLRRPMFQDKAVRRALLQAWDRARLNQAVFGSRYRLAVDTFNPETPFYPKGEPTAYDPKAAREILAPRKLNFTLLVNSLATERWASLFQNDMAKVGVTVELKRIEEDDLWWSALREGNYDAVAGQGGLNESVDATTWAADAPYNLSGFSSPEVDQMLAKLDLEFDPKKRGELESSLIEKLRADFAQIPGLQVAEARALVSARLEPGSPHSFQPWKWRTKH